MPIGTQETIATNPMLLSWLNNPLVPRVVSVAETFLGSHDIGLMIDQLSANAAVTPGDTGPQANLSIALGSAIANGFKYIALPVFGYADVEVDPPSGQLFSFTEDAGSPPLYSLRLPDLYGVTDWGIDEWLNGQWTPDTFLDPMEAYFFELGVTEFQFWALDENGNDLTIPNGFVFDLQFSQTGVFSGTVESTSVPEPRALLLLLSGIGIMVLVGTAQSWRWKRCRNM